MSVGFQSSMTVDRLNQQLGQAAVELRDAARSAINLWSSITSQGADQASQIAALGKLTGWDNPTTDPAAFWGKANAEYALAQFYYGQLGNTPQYNYDDALSGVRAGLLGEIVTIHFPDVSPFQGNISLRGAVAVALKTTEGSGWSAGSWFTAAVGRARIAGAFPIAYHFLHAGNPAGQAAWCNSRDGGLPLMLDWEPTGSSRPGVGDATGFIDAYRRAGGVVHGLYFPHWYWDQLGRPSLAPFVQRKMALWSSAYTAYSDHGSGWAAYGGMDVAVWQHTDKQSFNGQLIDFNAFKGTVAQLRGLLTGGAPAPPADPYPTIRKGDAGPAVVTAQKRLNTWGAARPDLTPDGDFGQRTHDATRQFQKTQEIAIDGVIGPGTWVHLNTNPKPPPAAPSTPPGTKPYHGEWVSAGQQSLNDLCNKTLGYPVNSVVRMTAVHYGAFDAELAGYIAGLANGTVKPTDLLPKGANLWCN